MSGSTPYETTQGQGGSFGARSVTAMFTSRTDAERAVERLVEEGFSRNDVRLMPGSERDVNTTSKPTTSTPTTHQSEGFWESLADFFFPDDDRDVYAEGLSRGGYLVSVSTTSANHDRAVDILDDDGTIDLDEQETSWRSQGWTGRSGTTGSGMGSGSEAGMSSGSGLSGSGLSSGSGMAGSGMAGSGLAGSGTSSTARGVDTGFGQSTAPASDRMAGSSLGAMDEDDVAGMDRKTDVAGRAGMTGSGKTGSGMAGSGKTGSGKTGSDMTGSGMTGSGRDRTNSEEVIPRAEEELRVGKREVEGGRVRVRSYVVETPVEQQVQLRREHVDVQRRAVDRTVGAGDDAFRERTVELDERTEQPVVSKEARIREEVVLKKDVDTEHRTVSDTVRRTEVEVDDQRGKDAQRSANENPRRKP